MARSATGMTGQAQSMLKTSNRTESELAASLLGRFLSPQRTVSQCSRQCGSQARQGQSSSQPPQTARSVWVTCKHPEILNIKVLWWDTRNFTEPVDRLVLDPYLEDEDNVSRAQGASILEYEWTIPSKFMVGTQQGKVIFLTELEFEKLHLSLPLSICSSARSWCVVSGLQTSHVSSIPQSLVCCSSSQYHFISLRLFLSSCDCLAL